MLKFIRKAAIVMLVITLIVCKLKEFIPPVWLSVITVLIMTIYVAAGFAFISWLVIEAISRHK